MDDGGAGNAETGRHVHINVALLQRGRVRREDVVGRALTGQLPRTRRRQAQNVQDRGTQRNPRRLRFTGTRWGVRPGTYNTRGTRTSSSAKSTPCQLMPCSSGIPGR